jgi:hypothetical protein
MLLVGLVESIHHFVVSLREDLAPENQTIDADELQPQSAPFGSGLESASDAGLVLALKYELAGKLLKLFTACVLEAHRDKDMKYGEE